MKGDSEEAQHLGHLGAHYPRTGVGERTGAMRPLFIELPGRGLLGNWAGCGITCSRKYAVRGGVDEPPRLLPQPRLLPHEEVTHEEVKPSG